MAKKCFMCGREIAGGRILCDKCDKPRKPKVQTQPGTTPIPQSARQQPADPPAPSAPAPPRPSPPQPQSRPAPPQPSSAPAHAPETSAAHALAAFPEAPLLKFPVEAASPSITSVVNLLIASGVASILLGPDRSVKFVSDAAQQLFDAPHSDLTKLKFLEGKTGIRVGDLSVPASAGISLRNRNFLYSLVPMSGGATGAALVFRPADPIDESQASFVTYIREAVSGPLRSLRDSLAAAAAGSPNEPLLGDSASTIEQVLSSLEMAPGVDVRYQAARPVPTVSEVVRRVAERFSLSADLKGVHLQVDAQDLDERFADHEQLADALAILTENAMHYVPGGGQVVTGVRWMEHKGKPLLLFFVIDTGPIVPEDLRQSIFDPAFVWNPGSAGRTGRGLFKVREFAVAHAGSVWVEARTGKACTFFLRVRPDGVR